MPTGMLWERVFGLFYDECVEDKQPIDFDTAEDYVKAFKDFLRDKHNLPDNAPTNSVIVQDCLANWFHGMEPVRKKLHESKITDDFLGVAKINYDELGIALPSEENLEDFLDAWPDLIENVQNQHNTNEWNQRALRVNEHHNENSKFIASKIVDGMDLKPKKERKDLLRRMFNLHLVMTYMQKAKESSWVSGSTTIAVVGFGATDVEPRMFELNSGLIIDPEYGCVTTIAKFVIRNRTSLMDKNNHQIRCEDCDKELSQFGDPVCPDHGLQELYLHSAPAFLNPFAMCSEIQNTLNGLHDDLKFIYRPDPGDLYNGQIDFPGASAERLANGILGDLNQVPGLGPKTHEKIQKAFKQNIQDNIENCIRERAHSLIHTYGEVARRQKFRVVVMGLPIADLSDFARTLVNLQANINYYLEPVRSVGGDIALASITKEDGFAWRPRNNRRL